MITRKRNTKSKTCFLTVAMIAISFTLLFCGSSVLVDSAGTDSSVFYTVGRGMVQGKIAYRDLFDHKGLYLYLLNALGVLIADRHMLGLWLVETAFVLADCFLVFRIARKLGGPDRVALLATLLTMVFASCYWEGGNLTETYGLLPELCSFSLLLDIYEGGEENPFPAAKMFPICLCAGVELFLRANMVMAWIPVALLVLGRELRARRFRNAGMILLFGLLGVLAASALPLLYCRKNDCFSEMVYASYLFNFRYLGDRAHLTGSLRQAILLCFFLLAFVLGIVSSLVVWKNGKNRIGRWLFVSSFLFAVMSVLLSGRLFRHYSLYLIPFAIPCLVRLAKFLGMRLRFWRRVILVMLAVMMTVAMNSSVARDTVKRMIHYSGTNYSARALVAEELEEKYPDSQDLLVANGSAWYYVFLGRVPEQKFFYLPTVSYAMFPDALDAQADAIRDGAAEAVILEWESREQQIALPEGARNDDVLAGLAEHYTEVYTADGIGLYLRKDAP